MPKKFIEDFVILENKRQTSEFVILTLQHPTNLPKIYPGQFAEIKVEGSPNTFLRRPLSIHDVDYQNNTIKLLVQEVGEGTRRLAAMKPGESLNLIYPLGTYYSLPSSNKVLLVGGGCGVAPLLFLGRFLHENGIKPRFLIGAKSSAQLVELDEYRKLGEVFITTEDGSAGTKGFVIHHPIMKTYKPDFDWIYTCGPEAMMKVIAKYALKRNLNCEVSLENMMACGIGACLCCITPTIEGNKCTCTDGPVFNSKYLKW
ncbi:dihydroorotate dehydrogenase electron transfer subunit [Thermophagus xiamenensis]|uniref:Dihydroorotate oxidase B, electron transfer subunit n=1 Tax=Thermophagus xiamenensis TaxID=385682 RepID=A0A1I1WIA8_9BACT|nr:dihydroorotate dehydrogenase electron transfer subunit [Thermophagus xiamenensis]SFD94812.1 dihydroorotate oxidase B, electron transfer subunit [Thermophagus xiamenensis]